MTIGTIWETNDKKIAALSMVMISKTKTKKELRDPNIPSSVEIDIAGSDDDDDDDDDGDNTDGELNKITNASSTKEDVVINGSDNSKKVKDDITINRVRRRATILTTVAGNAEKARHDEDILNLDDSDSSTDDDDDFLLRESLHQRKPASSSASTMLNNGQDRSNSSDYSRNRTSKGIYSHPQQDNNNELKSLRGTTVRLPSPTMSSTRCSNKKDPATSKDIVIDVDGLNDRNFDDLNSSSDEDRDRLYQQKRYRNINGGSTSTTAKSSTVKRDQQLQQRQRKQQRKRGSPIVPGSSIIGNGGRPPLPKNSNKHTSNSSSSNKKVSTSNKKHSTRSDSDNLEDSSDSDIGTYTRKRKERQEELQRKRSRSINNDDDDDYSSGDNNNNNNKSGTNSLLSLTKCNTDTGNNSHSKNNNNRKTKSSQSPGGSSPLINASPPTPPLYLDFENRKKNTKNRMLPKEHNVKRSAVVAQRPKPIQHKNKYQALSIFTSGKLKDGSPVKNKVAKNFSSITTKRHNDNYKNNVEEILSKFHTALNTFIMCFVWHAYSLTSIC